MPKLAIPKISIPIFNKKEINSSEDNEKLFHPKEKEEKIKNVFKRTTKRIEKISSKLSSFNLLDQEDDQDNVSKISTFFKNRKRNKILKDRQENREVDNTILLK